MKTGQAENRNKYGDTGDDVVSSKENTEHAARVTLMDEMKEAGYAGTAIQKGKLDIIEEVIAREDVADGRGLGMAENYFDELYGELLAYMSQRKSMSWTVAKFVMAKLAKMNKLIGGKKSRTVS